MDDRLAKWFYEDNLLSKVNRLRGDVNLLQKLATETSVDMGAPPVPGVIVPPFAVGDITLSGDLGIHLIRFNQNIAILQEGADHSHGLARWTSYGGSVFELPDIWDSVSWVTINGLLEDPFLYSLSSDGTQLIFNDAVLDDNRVVMALGQIRQV